MGEGVRGLKWRALRKRREAAGPGVICGQSLLARMATDGRSENGPRWASIFISEHYNGENVSARS